MNTEEKLLTTEPHNIAHSDFALLKNCKDIKINYAFDRLEYLELKVGVIQAKADNKPLPESLIDLIEKRYYIVKPSKRWRKVWKRRGKE